MINDSASLKDSQANAVFYEDNKIRINSINKDSYDNYNTFDYKRFIDKSNLIKSKNDSLIFPIGSTKTIYFTDTLTKSDNSELRINEHIGNLLNYYVVQSHYYESSDFFLINKTTGVKYELVSEPYLSPNKSFIISNSASLDYSVMPTEFQVWSIENENLKKIIDIDLSNKGFEFTKIKMISDNKLAVKIGFIDDRVIYGLMTIK
jgi:hypothetical protein